MINKYQKALKTIKDNHNYLKKPRESYGMVNLAFEDIQELVDLRTLKKVAYEHAYICDRCWHWYTEEESTYINFCPNCGQALGWSVDND